MEQEEESKTIMLRGLSLHVTEDDVRSQISLKLFNGEATPSGNEMGKAAAFRLIHEEERILCKEFGGIRGGEGKVQICKLTWNGCKVMVHKSAWLVGLFKKCSLIQLLITC